MQLIVSARTFNLATSEPRTEKKHEILLVLSAVMWCIYTEEREMIIENGTEVDDDSPVN